MDRHLRHQTIRARSRALLVALAAGIAIAPALAAVPASAQGTLDQTVPYTGLNWYGQVTYHYGRGQSFTAGASGAIDSVEVTLRNDCAAGDLVVDVYAADGGIPTGQPLATQVVPESELTAQSFTTYTVSFDNPATITAGNQYALVLTAPSAPWQDQGGEIEDLCGYFWAIEHDILTEESSLQLYNSAWATGLTDYSFSTFVSPVTEPTPTPTPAAPSAELATTGVEPAGALAAAAVVIGVGAAVLRRRRSRQ